MLYSTKFSTQYRSIYVYFFAFHLHMYIAWRVLVRNNSDLPIFTCTRTNAFLLLFVPSIMFSLGSLIYIYPDPRPEFACNCVIAHLIAQCMAAHHSEICQSSLCTCRVGLASDGCRVDCSFSVLLDGASSRALQSPARRVGAGIATPPAEAVEGAGTRAPVPEQPRHSTSALIPPAGGEGGGGGDTVSRRKEPPLPRLCEGQWRGEPSLFLSLLPSLPLPPPFTPPLSLQGQPGV